MLLKKKEKNLTKLKSSYKSFLYWVYSAERVPLKIIVLVVYNCMIQSR